MDIRYPTGHYQFPNNVTAATRLQLDWDGNHLAAEKTTDGDWRLTEPFLQPADSARITADPGRSIVAAASGTAFDRTK